MTDLIMHYGLYTFSKNGEPTISVRDKIKSANSSRTKGWSLYL